MGYYTLRKVRIDFITEGYDMAQFTSIQAAQDYVAARSDVRFPGDWFSFHGCLQRTWKTLSGRHGGYFEIKSALWRVMDLELNPS